MPSARARSRGDFLNCRFAVNGIQNAACSRPAWNSARLFMRGTLLLLSRVGDDLLPLLAEALDAHGHDVAGLEEHRVRLHAEADAGRGAGGDDVAWKERHVVADVGD